MRIWYFVPILEGHPVPVCPNRRDRDFFRFNCSPVYFYRLPSGFLLRRDKLKSSLLTFLDFWFSSHIFVVLCHIVDGDHPDSGPKPGSRRGLGDGGKWCVRKTNNFPFSDCQTDCRSWTAAIKLTKREGLKAVGEVLVLTPTRPRAPGTLRPLRFPGARGRVVVKTKTSPIMLRGST